jgi:4-hydroxy-tetrahydrodipicolinate reductase
MRIIITGYGRMGREVEAALLSRKHSIAARIDSKPGAGDYTELSTEILAKADAVIEFSLPSAVLENVKLYTRAGIPAVIGTTGWEKDRQAAEKLVLDAGSALLWGNNFSIGAHIFFHLTGVLAGLINGITEYDIMGYELHHNQKKDSPSGTALTMAEHIMKNCTRKKSLITDKIDRQIQPEELHIASIRGGSIPGIHKVLADSLADTIELSHTARSRGGFALGSVLAAEWLINKKGFYNVENFIKDLLKA